MSTDESSRNGRVRKSFCTDYFFQYKFYTLIRILTKIQEYITRIIFARNANSYGNKVAFQFNSGLRIFYKDYHYAKDRFYKKLVIYVDGINHCLAAY